MSEKSHKRETTIAYFVTDHGFGHATRAAAVMNAIAREIPNARFEVFTTAPDWLFKNNGAFRWRLHAMKTDVGLVQSSPFEIDLKATVAELAAFLPFSPDSIADTAAYLQKLNCRLVICDISPIGIEIANKAGIPAALIENFTWDWIYAPYYPQYSDLQRFGRYLSEIYDSARIRVQVAPFCSDLPGALKTNPVCRPLSSESSRVREGLGVQEPESMVLLSMGGLARQDQLEQRLPSRKDIVFVIAGGSQNLQRHNNVILLPPDPEFGHPDLVNAADVVIGKVGYSTVAEVYQAGVPFGYLARHNFRESAVLAEFVVRHIPSLELDLQRYMAGDLSNPLDALLALRRLKGSRINGARQAARHLASYL